MEITTWMRHGCGWKRTPAGWIWVGESQIVIPDPEHRLCGADLGPLLKYVAVRGYTDYEEKLRCEMPKTHRVPVKMQWIPKQGGSASSAIASSSGVKKESKAKQDMHPIVFSRLWPK